jgi:SAM-dependent methyltransferase
MTAVSQRQLREWLSIERPTVVADIGGRDSRTAYADICPADIYDLQSSPSFDICANELPQKYSHIVSTDTWEHILDPVSASRNVGRSLLPGGRLFLTTVSSWPEHRHPIDTYRFMEDGLRWLFRDLTIDRCWYEDDPDGGKRISLIARKQAGE